MTSKGKRILLVEDNEKIMFVNRQMLDWEGYEVTVAPTLTEAKAFIHERRPDAIVLDIMLPDGSGLDFMRELRQSKNANIPILLLTGLAEQEDIVRGLAEGGDDYLTKPYDFPILLARIEALLRRAARVPEVIRKGRLSLDVTADVAALDGRDLLLSQKEFALLQLFTQNEGRSIGSEYLYEKIWNAPMAKDSGALTSCIKRLRAKIEGSGWQIAWARGSGYIFERE